MCLSTTKGFEPMLTESINHFLASYRNGSSDFSNFQFIFFRLIQTMPDPPLEITWFYSAVTFHTSKSAGFSKIVVAKDLFHLLISCSGPCNGLKKIALLAPVLYVLYDVICEFSRNGLCLNGEIRDLVEKIVGYICICLGDSDILNEFDENILYFEELVGVWTIDRVECAKFDENLGVFFPILSVEVHEGRNIRHGIRDLAGIVICEVFLLNLSMKFNMGFVNEDVQNDARNWAIQTLKQFQNFEHLDLLLRILLEKRLVVTTLLQSSEDAVILQKLLYDAVILIDNSFLSSSRWFQLPESHFRNLALLWSLVADNAIQFAREICDQDRVLAYVNAFSESQLPSKLLKWVSTRAGTEENLRNPKFTTPKALIKWLFILEDQGLWVFDHDKLKFHAKAAICNSLPDCCLPESKPECWTAKERERREGKYIGDEEMEDSLDKPVSAAYFCTDKLPTDGDRKRKDPLKDTDIRGTPVKLVKYNVHESI